MQAPATRHEPAYGSDDLPSQQTRQELPSSRNRPRAPFYEVPHVRYLSNSNGYIATRQI